MGKYIKKTKITPKVALMDIPPPHKPPCGGGVWTRARTLAVENNGLCFLELRSRRLLKPSFGMCIDRNTPDKFKSNLNSRGRVDGGGSDGGGGGGDGGEGSGGENNLDFVSRERSTRESTPCSLIRDSETIGMPGSTTRPTCSTAADRRARNTQRTMPTDPELEEFFADLERENQKYFIEKYNFDITNDVPLPGHYEWVKVE